MNLQYKENTHLPGWGSWSIGCDANQLVISSRYTFRFLACVWVYCFIQSCVQVFICLLLDVSYLQIEQVHSPVSGNASLRSSKWCTVNCANCILSAFLVDRCTGGTRAGLSHEETFKGGCLPSEGVNLAKQGRTGQNRRTWPKLTVLRLLKRAAILMTN